MVEQTREDQIISGRTRDLGGFTVSRSLPSAQRRQVGPFVFLDHMGPLRLDSHHALDVRPHPHIGLSTVTYLFEGRGMHRDSLGSMQIISPGDINWMTAGRGIVHSERTPPEDRVAQPAGRLHGIQIWVGLPIESEECEPGFAHYPKAQLPVFSLVDGLAGSLLIGEYEEVKSPVRTFSRTFFADVISATSGVDTQVSLPEKELGIFLVEGEAQINGHTLAVDDLIVLRDPSRVSIKTSGRARFILIGGDPFDEPRFIWWNFVSSSKEKIHNAADLWRRQKMGVVPDEVDYIPLPKDPLP